MLTLFLAGLRGPQLILIILVILLIFGAAKIPNIMRNLGKGVHSFRQGIEDAKEEMNREIRKAGTSDPEAEKPHDDKN